jgi:hypothetical protein
MKPIVQIAVISSAAAIAFFILFTFRPYTKTQSPHIVVYSVDTAGSTVSATMTDSHRKTAVMTENMNPASAHRDTNSSVEKAMSTSIPAFLPKQKAILTIEPMELVAVIPEGEHQKLSFLIRNSGTADALLNFYKSQADASPEHISQRIEDVLRYKVTSLSGVHEPSGELLTRASLYSGANWLIMYPMQAVIKAQDSLSVDLTVDTKELSVGEHTAGVIAVGISREEIAVLPLRIQVVSAPRLRISNVQVFGVTAKNKDLLKSVLTVRNNGGADAQDISIRFSSDDPRLRFLGATSFDISRISAGGEERVAVQAYSIAGLFAAIPPTVRVVMTDAGKKVWQEEFYLGVEGKIHYPTGLVRERSLK